MVFLSLRCLYLLEAYADLGQIAKLSPVVLAGYAELGLSDSVPISVWVCRQFSLSLRYFNTVLFLSGESSANVHLVLLISLLFFESLISSFGTVYWVVASVLGHPNFTKSVCCVIPLFSKALIMSAKSFLKGPTVSGLSSLPFLSLCRAPVAGLHCLLPSTS